MFPLSAERLSFLEIAKYWAREIQPPASQNELLAKLESAWWRGEIVGISPTTRLDCLATMYRMRHQQGLTAVVFVTRNDPARPPVTELEDGSAEVDLSPRISVPSEIEEWTEDTCAAAFSALADAPFTEAEAPSIRYFPIFSPVLSAIELTSEEFFRWVATRHFDVPKFWRRNNAANVSDYRTGAPGRPTSSHLVEAELDRRIATGTVASGILKEARSLVNWLKSTHPFSPPMGEKTIKNQFSQKIRNHINARK
jgi:hypothetical protein